jgi:hypothetical protein
LEIGRAEGSRHRNMLAIYELHRTGADVETQYVGMKEGRGGLVQVKGAERVKISTYMENKSEVGALIS